MPKKCKDCDPNKYIEGLAYRGRNGHSFDGFTSYNDVGQPYDSSGNPTQDILANVNDMLDAYNPIFSPGNANGLPVSQNNGLKIAGIDRGAGFWFVWSLSEGIIAYGRPGLANTPANINKIEELQGTTYVDITSDGTLSATAYKDRPLNLKFTTDIPPSYLTFTGFDVFGQTNTSDGLRFLNTNTLIKSSVNYVGYYTGYITSHLKSNKEINIGTQKKPIYQIQTITSKRSLTILSRASNGDLPVEVTSAPTVNAFRGQAFNYQITTNLNSASSFTVIPTSKTLDIINNLGLTWNVNTKTISGNVSNAIGSQIKIDTLTFIVRGSDYDSGNQTTFNLSIIYGDQATSGQLPTVSNASYTGKVGSSFSESLRGLNGKQKILNVVSLPEGLSFNSTNGKITGTVKHAGVFIAYVSASNDRGSSSKATLTFSFSNYLEKDSPEGSTYPNIINLPKGNFDAIKNNKFIFKSIRSNTGDDTISFKRININEIQTIIKNNKPDGNILTGTRIDYNLGTADQLTFFPGRSKEQQMCFWIAIDDPTKSNQKNGEFNIDVIGEYDVDFANAATVDAIGNACYPPGSTNGPVSTPYSQSVNITVTGNVKDGFSANPAENLPSVSFSSGALEHQIVFTSGPGFDRTSNFALTRLSKSQLYAYPNGIPNQRGTYTFYVRLADICAFNSLITQFSLYIGTYVSPAPGDVYQCSYQGTCFVAGTKIKTPDGYKEIQDFKIGDDIYGYDENQNLKVCKVLETIDHEKEPYPVVKLTLEGGRTLRTTLSHPFLTPEGEYIFLKDLKINDYVMTYNRQKVKILNIEDDGFEVVYNVEVENLHNYIAEDIFVHNMGYSPGPAIGTVTCGKWGCQILTSKGWAPKGRITTQQNVTLTSYSLPANCHTLVSRGANTITINDYGYQYKNSLLESKDIGITSLTNISILDILSEGPIEGIVDYEIVPNQGYRKGDIGYKNGVTIKKYPGPSSLIRSIYWNEIPLADNSYGTNQSKGSLNFEFIRLKFDNGDSAPRHADLSKLKEINLEEEFYTRRVQNGRYVDYLTAKDENNTVLEQQIKLPRRLTSTKTVGTKLFGKRKFQDGTEKTYKKSITIMTKDLYGLKLHIKGISLFKQIVDLTIWDTSDQAAENSVGGRIDRQVMTFNLRLKRIDRGINGDGMTTVLVRPNTGKDSFELIMSGKLNAGSYIETFEWTGLNTIGTGYNENTIGWEIEIEPTYIESVDPNILLKSAIDSITEIYNDFLILPHTAGITTTFDARFFQSIPQRAYDTRLLKVKIPSNYNPYSRTYSPTVWDGTFKLAWTDNPAWCFYDLLTNKRYGLGKYLNGDYADKWTLYEISKYCDELVNDGKGGLEPRFTCNVLISTREDAYKVINDMASIFRAIVYYNAGLIMVSQDKPKESIYIFNNSNVKDGEFTYSNTSKRVRRNVALVRYNDKENFYKPAVKYTESRDGLIRFGIREIEVSAFGCTSEGQAERLGKWTLLSENFESELVSFETSLPALYLKPGDIILLQDQNRQNKVLAGRTYALDKNSAILDVKYENISGYLEAIKACKFNILTPAGNIEIGTDIGDEAMTYTGNNIFSYKDGNNSVFATGIGPGLIRRKQVQTLEYNTTSLELGSEFKMSDILTLETGQTYNGYTRINFGISLDDTQHTLMQNTVWTIEVDPNNYDYTKSPSVSGFSNTGYYPGAYLEPYMDKTQKFRVLDIEEQEEHRYKVTALQYDEQKYALGDDI